MFTRIEVARATAIANARAFGVPYSVVTWINRHYVERGASLAPGAEVYAPYCTQHEDSVQRTWTHAQTETMR